MPFSAKPDRFSSCAIIPGRTADPDGFVTEHTVVEGITGPIIMYFSVGGLRLLAERYPQVGLVGVGVLQVVQDENIALAAENEQLRAERDELAAKQERIIGLRKDGFDIQRQMGRPPTKKGAKA